MDDGSKDNTRELVPRYPVKYVYQENAGLSAARNRGIREATGDWIALLDADDYWLHEKLELQAAAIRDEGLCYCATTRFGPNMSNAFPEFFDSSKIYRAPRHHNSIDPSSVLIRRELIVRIGGFNEKMPAGEDWEAWLRLSRLCKFVGIPQRLLMYRVTGTSMSTNPGIFIRSMEYIVAARHGGPAAGPALDRSQPDAVRAQ